MAGIFYPSDDLSFSEIFTSYSQSRHSNSYAKENNLYKLEESEGKGKLRKIEAKPKAK